MNNLASANLREQLEEQLALIFKNDTINQYLTIDGHGSELQIIGDNCTFPQLSTAFYVWTTMTVSDRHQVLGKFQQLYTALTIQSPGKRKTLIFCALFVHELATILATATLFRCSGGVINDMQQN
jgi:hypothetical protein